MITTATLRDATGWDEMVNQLGLAGLVRHGLRHTALTWMADAGVELHPLRRVAGPCVRHGLFTLGLLRAGAHASGSDAGSSRPLSIVLGMANRYEYAVVELREGMLGGKMSGQKLQNVLNQYAAQGWQLKAITAVEVRGRVGPGGVEGVLVTFERPVG